MIRSMTAFASSEIVVEGYTLIWEIRSVNHRYLDVSPRLPEIFRSIEPSVREAVGKHLKRGKIDCNLFYRKDKGGEDSIEINEARLNQVLNAATKVEAAMNQFQALSPLDILRWPGVQSEVREDLEPVMRPLFHYLMMCYRNLLSRVSEKGMTYLIWLIRVVSLFKNKCL